MIAAILGAGPSLPEQFQKVPPDAILFGINHHASKMVDCDYIVFNDEQTWLLVKDLPGRKISRFEHKCDILFQSPPGLISGVCALNYALSQGFETVLLAGFDCYQTDEYFHSPGEPTNTNGPERPLKQHLDYWPRDPRVRALGGPLAKRFKDVPKDVVLDVQEVEIICAKTVVLDKDRHVHFVPGVQKLRFELVEAARAAGILKETE